MRRILSAQCYSLYIYSLLMFFLPQIISYSQFAIILSSIAAVAIVRYALKKRKVSLITFYTAIIGIVLVLLYYFGISGSTAQLQRTFFLVVLGQTFPAVLMASIIATERVEKQEENFEVQKIIFVYIIAMTFLVVMAILFPNRYTRGGGLTTEFVLNYQNGSYLCAYISNYIVYTFVTDGAKSRIKRIIYIVSLIFVTFAMFAMGGKGGFVTYVVINILLVLYAVKKSGVSATKLFRNVVVGSIAILALYYIILRASNFSLGGSYGFSRILALLSTHNDSGRANIYHKSLELIVARPIVGYGVGSVFGLLGTHAHNLFINCLLETGVVGTALLSILLLNTVSKIPKLIQYSEKNWVGIIIFMQGFAISMFSGYYLAQTLLFCGIVIIQGKSLRMQHERNQQ